MEEKVELCIHGEMPSELEAVLEGRRKVSEIISLSEQRNKLRQGKEGTEGMKRTEVQTLGTI